MESPTKVFMDSGATTRAEVDPDVPVVNATFLDTEAVTGQPTQRGHYQPERLSGQPHKA